MNIEFPVTAAETNKIGVNIQAVAGTTGVTAIQVENPECFKNGMVLPNMNWIFGQVDGVSFGMRFDPVKQRLNLFRNIGGIPEVEMGYVNMSYGSPDKQIEG